MTSHANNQTIPCAGPEALIPCCQPTNYGEAAAFRFNLPDCRRGGEKNEYVVFVVPRLKDEPPPKAPPRRPCPTRCPPRNQCSGYDPPDGCTQRTYISVAGISPPQACRPDPPVTQLRACGRDVPAARSRSPCCNFNRWSTEYRSTIGECARWVLDTDVRCKRRPIYPIQCLVQSPCPNQTTDEEQCAESQPTTCTVPTACYQRTCAPVNFKQEVVAQYPTRPPTDRSLPCPKPTITTTTTPKTTSRTIKTKTTASPTRTRKQITSSPTTTRQITSSPTTTRQITSMPTATRHRSPPQQVDELCEEDPDCCTSPTRHCSQIVGSRRPLPRCKMANSQACYRE